MLERETIFQRMYIISTRERIVMVGPVLTKLVLTFTTACQEVEEVNHTTKEPVENRGHVAVLNRL